MPNNTVLSDFYSKITEAFPEVDIEIFCGLHKFDADFKESLLSHCKQLLLLECLGKRKMDNRTYESMALIFHKNAMIDSVDAETLNLLKSIEIYVDIQAELEPKIVILERLFDTYPKPSSGFLSASSYVMFQRKQLGRRSPAASSSDLAPSPIPGVSPFCNSESKRSSCVVSFAPSPDVPDLGVSSSSL